jgi:hypothetical protein
MGDEKPRDLCSFTKIGLMILQFIKLQHYVRICQRVIFELENVLFNDNEQFLVDLLGFMRRDGG